MDTQQLKNKIQDVLINLMDSVIEYTPKLLFGIIVLILGFFIIKLLKYAALKVLKLSRFDNLFSFLTKSNFIKELKIKPSKLLTKVIVFILWLFLFSIVFDLIQLYFLASLLNGFLLYIPKLVGALIILTLGVLIAQKIKDAIALFFNTFGFKELSFIANIVFVVLLVFVVITTLNQAGINTQIITNNVTLILGGLLLIIVISLSIGSIPVVKDILKMYYVRKQFDKGDTIIYEGEKGEIEAIHNNYVKIKFKKTSKSIPISTFYENAYEIEN